MMLVQLSRINQAVQDKEPQRHILFYKTNVTPIKAKEENEWNQKVMATIKLNYFKGENTTFVIRHPQWKIIQTKLFNMKSFISIK